MSGSSPALPQEAHRLFAEYFAKIETCVGLLSHEQLWWRPNPRCNSVANLLLHVCGNLSQWVVGGLGGEPFERRRREEFATAEGEDGVTLVGRLGEVVSACRDVAGDLPEEKLAQVFIIQGIERTGFGVLLHAVEHMAYHTGQIIYVTKQLVGTQAEIEFYPRLK